MIRWPGGRVYVQWRGLWCGAALLLLLLALGACRGQQEVVLVPVRDEMLTVLAPIASDAEATAMRTQLDAFAQEAGLQAELQPATEWDQHLAAMRSGSADLDVVALTVPQAQALMAVGALAPLEGALQAVDDFAPVVRAAVSRDGHLYCAPRSVTALALIWNRTLFADKGVAEPDANWTWESMRSAAEALTELEQGVYGISLSPDVTRWLPFLYQAGGSLTDEGRSRSTLDSAAALQALEFYVGLLYDGYAATPAVQESLWSGEAFGRQRAAMAIEAGWIVPWMAAEHPDVDYGVLPLPGGPTGRGTLAFATCYAAPLAAEPTADTFALIDRLAGRDATQEWASITGLLPARSSAATGWVAANPGYAPFAAALEDARIWDVPSAWIEALSLLGRDMERVVADETTVAELQADAQNALAGALSPAPALLPTATAPLTATLQSPASSPETDP